MMKFNFPGFNLPAVPMKLRDVGDATEVFDPLRQKYIVLTPEEFVRQHFTAWMQRDFHYPASLMANEVGIKVNGTQKRCDTVVYDSYGRPLVIVEYKQPDVSITQAVFDQIARYNMELRADYLIVSNGRQHYCCKMDYRNSTYYFLPQIPDFRDLQNRYSDN